MCTLLKHLQVTESSQPMLQMNEQQNNVSNIESNQLQPERTLSAEGIFFENQEKQYALRLNHIKNFCSNWTVNKEYNNNRSERMRRLVSHNFEFKPKSSKDSKTVYQCIPCKTGTKSWHLFGRTYANQPNLIEMVI